MYIEGERERERERERTTESKGQPSLHRCSSNPVAVQTNALPVPGLAAADKIGGGGQALLEDQHMVARGIRVGLEDHVGCVTACTPVTTVCNKGSEGHVR